MSPAGVRIALQAVTQAQYYRAMLPSRKNRPDESVKRHLHGDSVVTHERLEAFVHDSNETQLKVLARLNYQIVNNNPDTLVGLLTVVFAFFAIIAGSFGALLAAAPKLLEIPVGESWPGLPFPVRWVLLTAGVLFIVLAFCLVIVFVVEPFTRRQAVSVLWLDAYRRELDRQFLARGRTARRWLRQHPH